jgi:enoyl-CoA hydratase/carnithine racemase
MVAPVSTAEFSTQSAKRKPESFEYVKFRLDKGVAHITLARPEHNLLNEAMLREIADGIGFAGDHDDVKLIVLDSACKVFSGGVDIGEYTTERVYQMLEAFQAAFASMLEVSKPVICVVNGPAIGGGAELAAFGDIVIATPKARFAQPEITIGVFPPLASTILPFLVGPKRALEIILTGEAINAERALELGLVTRLVPEAKLDQTVNELVGKNCRAFGAGAGYGQEGDSWRNGPFAARRPEKVHEHFPKRALQTRGLARRTARADRETQAELEKQVVRRGPARTRLTLLVARLTLVLQFCRQGKPGKAVRIGRGPATVIGAKP